MTITRVMRPVVLGAALMLMLPALQLAPAAALAGGAAPATYAAPPADTVPPADATLTVASIGVDAVPVWTGRPDRLRGDDPAFRYYIPPFYGVTRFAGSAAFGQPGLTVVFGQDDISGSVFRYLRHVRVGSRVTVRTGHTYRYTVRAIVITTPRQAGRLLDQTYRRRTLALVSCVPYWVDTQRIVVLADE